MATVLTDNFDSYTDGTIVGQGQWVNGGGGDNTHIVVQSTGSRSGKCVALDNVTNLITNSLTDVNDGSQVAYIKLGQNNKNFSFILLSGGSILAQIQFKSDTHIVGKYSGNEYDFGIYSADTYYKCVIEWESTNHKIRYSFNGSDFTSWYTPLNSWSSGGMDQVYFPCSDASGGTFFVDDLSENAIAVTASYSPVLLTLYPPIETVSVIDSYSESNSTSAAEAYGESRGNGQSFSNTIFSVLNNVKFYLKKVGSPTGNISISVYNHTGVYGTSSMWSGEQLAISEYFDSSSLSSDYGLIDFTFSGLNKIKLSENTKYALRLNFIGGDSSNRVFISSDPISPTHNGNAFYTTNGIDWYSQDGVDLIFYVYGITGGLTATYSIDHTAEYTSTSSIFTIPSVSASYELVSLATFSATPITTIIPSISANYVAEYISSFSPISSTFIIPNILATPEVIAVYNPLILDFSIPEQSISYIYELNSDYSSLILTLTPQSSDAFWSDVLNNRPKASIKNYVIKSGIFNSNFNTKIRDNNISGEIISFSPILNVNDVKPQAK